MLVENNKVPHKINQNTHKLTQTPQLYTIKKKEVERAYTKAGVCWNLALRVA